MGLRSAPRGRLLGVTALMLVLAAPAGARAAGFGYDIPVPAKAPWPEMRHDRRNTGAAPIPAHYPRGARPWFFKTGKGIFSTPTVGPGDVSYVGSGDGSFRAFSRRGRPRWRFRAGLIDSSAVLGRRAITIGTGDEYLYHLRTSARRMTRRRRILWRVHAVQPPGQNQLVDWWEGNAEVGPDGTIYAGNTGSAAYAITPRGKVKWIFRAGNSIWTSTAIADDGTTYWGSLDLFVYALGKDGKQVWRTPTLGFVISSPALSKDGSTLYIGSFDGQLHALDAKTGAPLWSFQTGDHIYSSPALEEDAQGHVEAIYVASSDGNVYKLDPQGHELWRYDTGDAVRSSPSLGLTPDGRGSIVYVGSSNGMLYALDGATGRRRWSFDGTPSNRVLRDRNDMNSSPALGRRGVYIGSESGYFWFVPYDYCLHARDRRCSTAPGEAFGQDLTRVFPVTAGGSTSPGGFPGALPAATTVIGRLVVHHGGRTSDASMQPIPSAHDLVQPSPPFDFTAALSGDGHFIFVRPTGILDPGRDYSLKVSGLYTEGGAHVGVQVVGGTSASPFSDVIRFHTAPSRGPLPLHGSRGVVPAFRIRRLAVPLPAFLPSVNQIGFDSYEWLAGILHIGRPDASGRGSLLAWVIGVRRRHGRWVADPKAGFAFPLAGTYLRDFVDLGLQNITLTFSFGSVPLDRLEFRGQLTRRLAMRGPNLYAEATCAKIPNYGPFLPTTTRLCNQDGKIIVGGTYLTQAYQRRAPANQRPRGVSVRSIELERPTPATDGHATAMLAVRRGASYRARRHVLSILLTDAATGQPVSLDYAHSTTVASDRRGNPRRVTLTIPAGTSMPEHVEAWTIADVYPVRRKSF